jgi:hypothetical protein
VIRRTKITIGPEPVIAGTSRRALLLSELHRICNPVPFTGPSDILEM